VPAGKPKERLDDAIRPGEDRSAREPAVDVLRELRGRRIAVGRPGLQAFRGDRRQRPTVGAGETSFAGHGPLHARGRKKDLMLGPAARRLRRRPGDVAGQPAGDDLVEHQAQRIHVGSGVDRLGIARQLLRAHVAERAHHVPGGGGRAAVTVGRTGDAEVDHLRLARGVHENVARLEVTVDHAPLVPVGDRGADAAQEPDAVPD
jgi:hypothetical protein